MSSEDHSIVEYYAESTGYRCGYCKSHNSNYSHGMWAHSLTVQDYQDLIDRGWRRSGSYCYKPTMNLTCCPMYTIKCSVVDFKLSKSQKKKLKRFYNFLAHGKKTSTTADNESASDVDSAEDAGVDCGITDFPDFKEKATRASANVGSTVVTSVEPSFNDTSKETDIEEKSNSEVVIASSSSITDTTQVQENRNESVTKRIFTKVARPGDGMDPNRPKCKKAKLLRKERKERKLAQLNPQLVNPPQTKSSVPQQKSLEDFLNEPLPDCPAHRLEIRLVRSQPESKEFQTTFKSSLEVYQRYQMTIHNDPIEKVNERQFKRFLVNSPLKPWKPKEGPPQGYGSFHQQYWLDGRLIAVGVIDILPYCVSSVYFFYDPEFHFLVLGTYGSLREIAFCRSLHHLAPSLRYYYMGFYIHSCPKMRYKGAFSPSFLLCPEVYSWHPIEYCLPLLERNKYSRLNDDPEAKDVEEVVNVSNVSVLFHNRAMRYQQYVVFNPSSSNVAEVIQYANLVGNKLSKRILLLLM